VSREAGLKERLREGGRAEDRGGGVKKGEQMSVLGPVKLRPQLGGGH
jgi:hypothetical protein